MKSKELKRKEATQRQAEYDALSFEEKLSRAGKKVRKKLLKNKE